MNPTGSFGAATGGLSPELQAAIQSRSTGEMAAPTSSQVTNSAPTADPSTQAPVPPTASAPMPGPQSTSSPQQDAGAKLPFDGSETKIIINTLSNTLKSLMRIHGGA